MSKSKNVVEFIAQEQDIKDLQDNLNYRLLFAWLSEGYKTTNTLLWVEKIQLVSIEKYQKKYWYQGVWNFFTKLNKKRKKE